MTSPQSYNLPAGILMTVLVGSAFIVHRHAEARYLAGGAQAAQGGEVMEGGSRADGGPLLAVKTPSGQQTPGHTTQE